MNRYSLTALILLLTLTSFLIAAPAPTRPVSIGVISNYDSHLARNANLGWVRMDIIWKEIQPTAGAWNIGQTNDRINYALANGQQVLAILHVVPPWLSSDGDIPPYSTTEWSAFVRRLAFEFRGRIAAYEIWNEPDQKNISYQDDGIGWGRNVEEPPLYIDFVRAAALEIRSQAPGTLVVAPAFMSRNNADGADNRKRRFLQQAESKFYPDGQGTSFIDVISVHNNAGSTEAADTMGWRLNYENLAYVWNHAASMRQRPVWVTEYGWRTNAVGETNQRILTCQVTQAYTGFRNPSYTHLNDWDVRRAFIYTDRDINNGISNTIYNPNGTPKLVVTQYLQYLPYPAVQQPTGSPVCTSATGFSSIAPTISAPNTLKGAFTDLGLRDPGAVIPAGFKELAVNRSPEGLGTQVLFGDSRGGTLSIDVTPARGASRGFLTEAGAEWTSGDLQISISGLHDGLPVGKDAVRAMAAALDTGFSSACLAETIRSDENAVQRLGFSTPKTPAGFTAKAARIEYTHLTIGCGAEVATHTPDLDFTWTFENAAGGVIRAGIYRYGQTFEGNHFGERSLHWNGTGGARYWVASDPDVAVPDRETLRAVAASMDSAFGKAESGDKLQGKDRRH
jgi:hypothetical protein